VTAAAPAAGTSALWTLVRASGTVDLILLTLTVALGVIVIGRGAVRGAPRFVFQHVHRDASLLAVVLLVAHVVAAVLLVHLDVIPAVVPFASETRRLYLGLGVLGADLMAVLAVTSMLRRRLGLRGWRRLHWAAYIAWAAAVVHGAAPGTDRRVQWVAYLDIVCVAVVLLALAIRLSQNPRQHPLRLLAVGAAASLSLAGFIAWMQVTPGAASTHAPRSSSSTFGVHQEAS
jgi:DMSO/TMAO reductase YedYZ heme-binding membrane subunit